MLDNKLKMDDAGWINVEGWRLKKVKSWRISVRDWRCK